MRGSKLCDHVQERTDLYRLRLHVDSGSGYKEEDMMKKKMMMNGKVDNLFSPSPHSSQMRPDVCVLPVYMAYFLDHSLANSSYFALSVL